MPSYMHQLDLYRGFNFKHDEHAPVGFITSMTIGRDSGLFAADLAVKTPERPTESVSVVSVLTGIQWETGASDGIYLSGQFSAENHKALATKIQQSDWPSGSVTFTVVVYEFDPVAKKYYKSLDATATALQGRIENNSDCLNLSVADDPSYEVQSPRNYTVQIGIGPDAPSQSITLATGHGRLVTKHWG